MKNITNILAVILLLFAGFFITACDDEETVVVPDNWVTVSTDPMTIGYEGGSLSCDYVLANGLDASVVYVINHENWCSGYVKDGKILINVDLSENINGRTAKMSLIYDESHKVELVVEQGKAPIVLVQGIDKSAIPESINIEETLDLNTVVKVLPTNASFQNMTFTLAEGSDAFVELSDAGVVKGINTGTAKINVATTDESGVTDVITLNVSGNIRLNRDSWTASTSITYTNGNNYSADGSTGKPEHLFDNSSTTFLSLVKPGKSYEGCTAGGMDEPVYFVVDMQTQQTFNYFTWSHRSNNSYNYLRVWGISMFGSNDGQNFTEIKSNIAIPYESNADEILIDIPESTYRYVKVQYTNWSDLNGVTGGKTMQVAEFGLGLKL